MIKIKTGFLDHQYFIIEDEEYHKAKYLFLNPEARTIFLNGVAIIGKNIHGFEPAYNEIMGWNPTHKIDADDWNEIRKKGIKRDMEKLELQSMQVLERAKHSPELLNMPLSEAYNQLMLKSNE